MKSEAEVVDIAKHLGRRRSPRVSPLVSSQVASLKQAEALQLQAGLQTPDGHKAEIHRAMAAAFAHAAVLVLKAYDDLSKRPML